MSLIGRWKPKQGVFGLAVLVAGFLLAAPAAQARVGIGLNLTVPPPVVAAPPVVVGPPAYYPPPGYYYAPPPGYYPGYYYAPGPGYYYAPAPSYGYFWYDRFGRRHWRR